MTRTAVVGAGIVGLAAAHALRARGADVTLYEFGPPGGGQSAGQGRIFRHAHEDPRLVALVARSRALWREWEQEFGVELVTRCFVPQAQLPGNRLIEDAGRYRCAVRVHVGSP